VVVKVLLNSGTTGLFINTQFVKRKGFNLERLKTLLWIKNMNEIVNVGGAIIYQIECNMFFKGYIERVRIDIYNLEKTEVILDMLWLAVHNPEIDWEKEVKIMRCLLICEKKKQEEKGKEVRKTEGKKKVEELVPKRFWKWKRVFGKAESERMPVQKVWDHAIELKEGFMPKKEKVYSLLKEE